MDPSNGPNVARTWTGGVLDALSHLFDLHELFLRKLLWKLLHQNVGYTERERHRTENRRDDREFPGMKVKEKKLNDSCAPEIK